MLINEILFESSRANLYHMTGIYAAMQILQTNMLEGYAYNEGNRKRISFTRNPNFLITGNKAMSVRFEFDQDKLRHKYKIKPYAFVDRSKLNEFEETIYTDKITNLNNYLIRISIPSIVNYNEILHEMAEEIDVNEHPHYDEYDPLFMTLINPRPQHYEIAELYDYLVMIKYLAQHPKMNKKDAKELKKLFDEYVYYTGVRPIEWREKSNVD